MPDITMCNGIGCNIKERCYRHTAKPTPFMQSYFIDSPIKKDNYCEYFWEAELKTK